MRRKREEMKEKEEKEERRDVREGREERRSTVNFRIDFSWRVNVLIYFYYLDYMK